VKERSASEGGAAAIGTVEAPEPAS
jgi:hypothetical protein